VAIIFVGGVHGVGKSTFCQDLSKHTGLQCLTASTLIRFENSSALPGCSKLVPNPSDNQQLLVRAVKKAVGSSAKRVILDGHFTLLKPNGEIEYIDLRIFEQLVLATILVLQDKPELICERLVRRDNHAWSIALMSAHQHSEIQWASTVASHLKIPLLKLNASDAHSLQSAINSFHSWISDDRR
jgi:adenylate kinase